MNIDIEVQENGCVCLVPDNNLVYADVMELDAIFNRLMEKKQHNVIVDMTHVENMDSSGLGTLIQAYRNFKKADGDMRLCHVNEHAMSILKTTRLDRIFNIYPTREDAAFGD